MAASDLPIGRWGNRLAARIPARLARQPPAMKTFVRSVREARQSLPLTAPVVEEMRLKSRD